MTAESMHRSWPSRQTLNEELFRRPPVPVPTGAWVLHTAYLQDTEQSARSIEQLRRGAAAGKRMAAGDGNPALGRRSAQMGAAYRIHQLYLGSARFTDRTVRAGFRYCREILDWQARIIGQMLAATRLRTLPEADTPLRAAAYAAFDAEAPASLVLDGEAEIRVDCRIHPDDGCTHVLLLDRGLGDARRSRLVQRLLEIETYRMLALLGFPVAQSLVHELHHLEERLQVLVAAVARVDAAAGADEDRQRLNDLLALASEIQRLSTTHVFRFDASLAYHELVENRLAGLREERLPGQQRLGSFLRRRLTPAMKTVGTVRQRLEMFAAHIDHTASLLRTRVELGLQQQNRELLASMNRRAALQLRLQQTLEGLSVVAISYYGVGLVYYLARALMSLGSRLDPYAAAGAAVPFAVAGAWWSVRRVKAILRTGDHIDPPD